MKIYYNSLQVRLQSSRRHRRPTGDSSAQDLPKFGSSTFMHLDGESNIELAERQNTRNYSKATADQYKLPHRTDNIEGIGMSRDIHVYDEPRRTAHALV